MVRVNFIELDVFLLIFFINYVLFFFFFFNKLYFLVNFRIVLGGVRGRKCIREFFVESISRDIFSLIKLILVVFKYYN